MSLRLDGAYLISICVMMIGFGVCLMGSTALDWLFAAA
jgi:hypothetical protein